LDKPVADLRLPLGSHFAFNHNHSLERRNTFQRRWDIAGLQMQVSGGFHLPIITQSAAGQGSEAARDAAFEPGMAAM